MPKADSGALAVQVVVSVLAVAAGALGAWGAARFDRMAAVPFALAGTLSVTLVLQRLAAWLGWPAPAAPLAAGLAVLRLALAGQAALAVWLRVESGRASV